MKKATGEEFDAKRVRLSDRILYALELAIEQEDISIAESLVRALELALELGSKAGREGKRVKLCMPLKHHNKADVLRLALNLGVPFAKTWSCYHNGATPCGSCDPCVTVNQAIQMTHEVKFR